MSDTGSFAKYFMSQPALHGVAGAFDQAVRRQSLYETFFVRAQCLGMTLDQARWLAERERSNGDFTDLLWRLDQRLDLVAENGWLVITLDDVLTLDELMKARFSPRTPLNERRWMQRPYGPHFATLSREKQRGLVEAAIAVTEELGGLKNEWPLGRAMAVVMPYMEEAHG